MERGPRDVRPVHAEGRHHRRGAIAAELVENDRLLAGIRDQPEDPVNIAGDGHVDERDGVPVSGQLHDRVLPLGVLPQQAWFAGARQDRVEVGSRVVARAGGRDDRRARAGELENARRERGIGRPDRHQGGDAPQRPARRRFGRTGRRRSTAAGIVPASSSRRRRRTAPGSTVLQAAITMAITPSVTARRHRLTRRSSGCARR